VTIHKDRIKPDAGTSETPDAAAPIAAQATFAS